MVSVLSDPEPKKYKNESAEKDKKSETLTTEEKNFLKEVEEKFGVKSEVPVNNKEEKKENKSDVEKDSKDVPTTQKPPFPAVIAIEIVNDTDSKSKGKRTIDANLGYGYRTNNGYSYTYFGKSNQDKGKFMIYPYSQEDIPAANINQGSTYSSYSNNKYSNSHASSVEIQPSQAYELVPVKNEEPSYTYNKPSIEFKTDYEKALEASSQSHTSNNAAQTLYTTYNGQEFSGLSGQFPSVMPNYFVDASQLLKNPYYQNAGLTQDHLRTQSSYLNQNQRIVPVLVLRVPSSYLKNPTAELYPNLPQNYPLSQHLNSVNLQELVNQYFKKNGYPFAPQIMYNQNSNVQSESVPQHYSNPYVRPTYTQADYSGVQYSAVKPVMARYPTTSNQQKYLVQQPQSLYQRPAEQQYEYEYKYVPQTEVKMQAYYIQPQYQHESQTGAVASEYQNDQSNVENHSSIEDTSTNVQYEAPQYSSGQQAQEVAVNYGSQNSPQVTAQPDLSQYVTASPEAYDINKENIDYLKQVISSEYESASPTYNSQSSEYYSSKPAQTNTVSVVPSNLIHSEQYQEPINSNVPQSYIYQSRANQDSSQSLAISENYPSKDHTIATVLPYSYKSTRKPAQSSVQTVTYVTPMPSAKYQSQYRVMVPQTVLKHPSSEKVSYVNSHSMHYNQAGHYANYNPESEYAASQYTAQVASKPSYPRNYHTHPKRMVKQDNKQETHSARVAARKQNDRSEKKKSS